MTASLNEKMINKIMRSILELINFRIDKEYTK